jgi:uncharacterized protein (DUF2141 family)
MRFSWLIAALPMLMGAAPSCGSIEVAVTGVRTPKGSVHVEICDQATFLKDCRWTGDAPAVQGTTIVTVRDVPAGIYAAQAFHDKNGNHEIDRGLFGIPLEGVGFSNDARIRMSPPHFDEASFRHDATDQRITFKLRYFV